jgi:hypothetical protein
MRRRNFLYSSGIIASAIIASPSAAWSADKRQQIKVLILSDSSSGTDHVHSVIKNSTAVQVKELALGQVSGVAYSSDGFLVTMNDGKLYVAGKIIFSSSSEMDISRVSVKIKNGNSDIQLGIHPVNDKTAPPEFWAFTRKKIDNGKIVPFMKRKKPAFLCIS